MEVSNLVTPTLKKWRDDPEKTIEWISMTATFFFLAWLGTRFLVVAAYDVISIFGTDGVTWKAPQVVSESRSETQISSSRFE